MAHHTGTTAAYTVNFFPRWVAVPAKNLQFDLLKAVGSTNSRRRWSAHVCTMILQVPSRSAFLSQMTTERYQQLWRAACRLAGLPQVNLPRLRHGGASADALAAVSDAEMLGRGPWASVQSIRRYRRPARYIKQLGLLSAEQVARAETSPSHVVRLMKLLLGEMRGELKRKRRVGLSSV